MESVITKIIRLPQDHKQSNASAKSLLRQSGYEDVHDLVSEKDILEGLFKHPECVGYWMQWSEDKRSSSGWYIVKNDGMSYAVGYFPEGEKETIVFREATEACATYIKREIESIRS